MAKLKKKKVKKKTRKNPWKKGKKKPKKRVRFISPNLETKPDPPLKPIVVKDLKPERQVIVTQMFWFVGLTYVSDPLTDREMDRCLERTAKDYDGELECDVGDIPSTKERMMVFRFKVQSKAQAFHDRLREAERKVNKKKFSDIKLIEKEEEEERL